MLKSAFILAFFLTGVNLSYSAYLEPFQGSRANAIANATTSYPVDASLISANPSHLSKINKKYFSITGLEYFFPQNYFQDFWGNNVSHYDWGLAVLFPIRDNIGLGFYYKSFETRVDNELWFLTEEGAFSFGYEPMQNLHIGLSLPIEHHWDFFPTYISRKKTLLMNLHAGLTYSFSQGMTLGVTYKNLITPSESKTIFENSSARVVINEDNDPLLIGGISYHSDLLLFAVDIQKQIDSSNIATAFGNELYLFEKK